MDILDFGSFIKQNNLCVFNIDGWSLIQRATFDIQVEGYPYHSIQIYADLAAKKYIRRVWGKSEATGEIQTMQDLKDLCAASFQRSMTCIGSFG